MKLSMVIPCYNEAASLPLLLDRCQRLTDACDAEVILVDNGSTDESATVLSQLLPRYRACRSVRVEHNQGYGFGILSGLAVAQGEILGWTHADLQTDPLDAARGLAFFDGASQSEPSEVFVKGRRFGRPWSDVVFTVGMSTFETLLLRKPMWDINAQPTMFHRAFFETWKTPPHDFALDLYAYCSARRAGAAVRRFPVHFGERAHGVSRWNVDFAAKRKFIRRTVDFSLRLNQSLSK